MSCYAYWTIGGFMSAMNIWMMNLWYIISYGVEVGKWICDDVWYWFEWF